MLLLLLLFIVDYIFGGMDWLLMRIMNFTVYKLTYEIWGFNESFCYLFLLSLILSLCLFCVDFFSHIVYLSYEHLIWINTFSYCLFKLWAFNLNKHFVQCHLVEMAKSLMWKQEIWELDRTHMGGEGVESPLGWISK